MGTIFDGITSIKGETRMSGVAGFCDTSVAVGKIYIWKDEAHRSIPDPAIICILDGNLAACSTAYISISPPSAVILTSAAISAKLLSFLACSKIPYLILNEAPKFPEIYAEQVAILDTENSLLIINPQIETLNEYSIFKGSKLFSEEFSPKSSCTSITGEKSKKSLLVDGGITDGNELFENLLNIAEGPFPLPAKVMLCAPRTKEEKESFGESIEALFRASIYGNFSLLLRGYSHRGHISAAFSCMNKVFCRLEEEEREFNGYIKKGILIDAPIWLMQPPPIEKPDFICIDIDMLLCRFFGTDICENICEEQELSLLRIWEQYLSYFAPECSFLLKSKNFWNSSLVNNISSMSQISEIYIDI